MNLRAVAATSLSRSQKDVVIGVYRWLAWKVMYPYRAWRRSTIESRVPDILGRTWRTDIPLKLHLSLINGAMKYTYRDVRMVKHPVDLALYMKLLWELKPRSVIEIGSKDGGTASWFGDMMEVFGLPGLVVSIDLQPPNRPPFAKSHVRFLQGDEGDLRPLQDVFEDLPHPWFVINDASHNASAMLKCFEFLHGFMENGDYLVVEDGFLTELGLDWDGQRKGGPGLATAIFMQNHPGQYEVDERYCDHFGRNVTANPNGYLRRI